MPFPMHSTSTGTSRVPTPTRPMLPCRVRFDPVKWCLRPFIPLRKKKSKATADSDLFWNFDTLVIDEAAQIEDSKLFIVLARCPTLTKVILVGDPKQIQPYVPDSLRMQKYGVSTMERLMDTTAAAASSAAAAAPYIMLEEQFRMAPVLRQVVSHLYYEDRLAQVSEIVTSSESKAQALARSKSIRYKKMAFNRLQQSYENRSEAAVCKAVFDFICSSEFEGCYLH